MPLSSLAPLMVEATVHTPDLAVLQAMYETIPVFVFGAEKRGFSEEGHLQGAPLIGYGRTALDGFSAYMNDNLKCPLVFINRTGKNNGKLYGDIYSVPISTILHLDNLYQNGTFHERIIRLVKYFPWQERDKPTKTTRVVWASMYVAKEGMWDNDKEAIRLLPRITPKKDPDVRYFYYSKKEDQQ